MTGEKVFGLRQRILKAQSEQEILDLLKEGKTFKVASERTKRTWRRTGKDVLAKLNSFKADKKDKK